MKILLIHNIITPYRTPLFERLSHLYNVKVLFLEAHDPNRMWNQSSDDLSFNHGFLKNNNYLLFKKKITLNSGLKKEFEDFDPDVLVTLDNPPNFPSVIRSIRIAKKRKLPVIIWTGAFSGYQTFQKSKLKNKLTLFAIKLIRIYIYQRGSYIWAYSKETKKYLNNKFQIDNKKIKTGLQGYPDSLLMFEKIDLEERYQENKILFIGSIEKRKGIILLLEVFKKLSKLIHNCTLNIVGNGILLNQLKDQYKNDYNINFLDYIDGKGKFDLINESKILILPSLSDPWGWVVNESTSGKVPALVSDSVMAKEVVNDHRLIFKTNDFDDFYNKLKILLQLPFQEYKDLSEKVHLNSKAHNLDKSINSFNEIIRHLL